MSGSSCGKHSFAARTVLSTPLGFDVYFWQLGMRRAQKAFQTVSESKKRQ
jgi:hypothetical protein